ncbi:hypothetical protein AVEN_38288-1 [Araneus ventricosus]|uniref:Uncharacterized protein n=1 Tax=Araneus ventricosus TaxID=182803 RepID=A0A4Y2E4M4_ARAVE|nr:hypothetical protein AVEN_38288-1 [Araneus ventricosus]
MRTTPELAPRALQTSSPHQQDLPTYVQHAQYTKNFQWNLVSNLEPSVPEADTLPQGRRGLVLSLHCILSLQDGQAIPKLHFYHVFHVYHNSMK